MMLSLPCLQRQRAEAMQVPAVLLEHAQVPGIANDAARTGLQAPEESAMDDKFDPAPHDKHAENPHAAAREDRRAKKELDKGLRDTFPASDPVSVTQPSTTKKSDEARKEPRKG
jgi:hypothetical protein